MLVFTAVVAGCANTGGQQALRLKRRQRQMPPGKIYILRGAIKNKSVSDYLGNGERIFYINVLTRLSIDCARSGNSKEPDMHDIGILSSVVPVALDQACINLVWNSEDNRSFIKCVESRNGLHTFENAETIGLVLCMVLGSFFVALLWR